MHIWHQRSSFLSHILCGLYHIFVVEAGGCVLAELASKLNMYLGNYGHGLRGGPGQAVVRVINAGASIARP